MRMFPRRCDVARLCGYPLRSSCNIDSRGDWYEARFVLIRAIALADSFHLSIEDRDVGDLTTHVQESVEGARRMMIMSSNKYSLYPRLIHWKLMHRDGLIYPESFHERLR